VVLWLLCVVVVGWNVGLNVITRVCVWWGTLLGFEGSVPCCCGVVSGFLWLRLIICVWGVCFENFIVDASIFVDFLLWFL